MLNNGVGFHRGIVVEDQMQKENEFNAWLDSIEFVDESGRVVPITLTDDVSDDPEGDRA